LFSFAEFLLSIINAGNASAAFDVVDLEILLPLAEDMFGIVAISCHGCYLI